MRSVRGGCKSVRMCVGEWYLSVFMYSLHMHVLTPTQLIAKAEALAKERQKAEERKVQSTFSVLQACY